MVPHMVQLQDVVKLHTFVLGHLWALLSACFGFDLRFALVAFDLVSDSIWCEGVGVGVGARGGSTWAGGDQQSMFAHTHTSSSDATTSPWSPNPYPHCDSTGYGPRAGAVTRARCAGCCHGGRGKCEADEVKVVRGRDGQGSRLGKVRRYDKKTSWTEALPAWAASRSTS